MKSEKLLSSATRTLTGKYMPQIRQFCRYLFNTVIILGAVLSATIHAASNIVNITPSEIPMTAKNADAKYAELATKLKRLDQQFSIAASNAQTQINHLDAYLKSKAADVSNYEKQVVEGEAERSELKLEHENGIIELKLLNNLKASEEEAQNLTKDFALLLKHIARQESKGHSPVSRPEWIELAKSLHLVLQKLELKINTTRNLDDCVEKLRLKRLACDPEFASAYRAEQEMLMADRMNRNIMFQEQQIQGQYEQQAYELRKNRLNFQNQFNKLSPGTQWIEMNKLR